MTESEILDLQQVNTSIYAIIRDLKDFMDKRFQLGKQLKIMDTYNLERFLEAQEFSYTQALKELRQGEKRSHWMWYIFPQLKGLGRSCISDFYGISGLEEAKAYLDHPVLGQRLRTSSPKSLINSSMDTIAGRV